MNKAPAFQFYPQDYLASSRVAEMTLEEEGVYIRLLCYCWTTGSIPADPARCAKLAGKGCSIETATSVQRAFNVCSTDVQRMVHDRLEKERENQRLRREQTSNAGKKSAQSRAKKTASCDVATTKNKRSTDVQQNVNPSSSSSSSDEDAAQPASSFRNEASASCSEPSCGSSKPEPGSGIKIPTVGKDAGEYEIPQSKLDEWKSAFPGVDVMLQCRKASQWCRDNPAKRKTRAGVNRFLNTWLSREQDSGPRNGTAHTNGKSNGHGDSEDWMLVKRACTKYPREFEKRLEMIGEQRRDALKEIGGIKAVQECTHDLSLKSLGQQFDYSLAAIRKASNGTT